MKQIKCGALMRTQGKYGGFCIMCFTNIRLQELVPHFSASLPHFKPVQADRDCPEDNKHTTDYEQEEEHSQRMK